MIMVSKVLRTMALHIQLSGATSGLQDIYGRFRRNRTGILNFQLI
jgi:hypothetical protein